MIAFLQPCNYNLVSSYITTIITSIYLFVCLSVCLSLFISINLSMIICLYVLCISFYLDLCISVHIYLSLLPSRIGLENNTPIASLLRSKTQPQRVIMKIIYLMVELWGMWRTPSLPSLPGQLWPGVVAPERILYMGQIELNCVLSLNWIVRKIEQFWHLTVCK